MYIYIHTHKILTNTRSLFKLKNTSCFFMVLKSAMSPGSNRACSTASAMYPSLPCWKSFIEVFEGRGDPFSINGGFQAWILEEWSHPLSIVTLSGQFWPLWPSSEVLLLLWENPSPPSSTTSFPLRSRFLFLSIGSA